MKDNIDSSEYNKILFSQLVMMLSSSAMQQLGKLVNPITHKVQVDLEGAQMTIDLLEMIHAKTKGNLDDEEEKMLSSIISSLQLNFVETKDAPPAESGSTGNPQGSKTGETSPSPEAPDGSPKDDKNDPKFHKSYG